MAQEIEPIVRIRELKKDRVNFVLENVDMAYVFVLLVRARTVNQYFRMANSIRRVCMADLPTVGSYGNAFLQLDILTT